MADIKIYGVPPSSFTRTVRLACHEKGIDYELVPMFPGQMGALNPFQKIPAITHGDLTLFESTAILRYFDRTFPGPKLWPVDSRQAALCDQYVSAVCDPWSTRRCAISPTISVSCRYRRRWPTSISPRRKRSCRCSTAGSAKAATWPATA